MTRERSDDHQAPARDLAAMVLAAGHGTRLAPLTDLLPKPLCPVGNSPMIDIAMGHAAAHSDRIAVNVHRFRDEFERWRPEHVYLSIESELLGTAGGVANIRPWLGDDDLLAINGDALLIGDLGPFVSGWDRETIRLLVIPDVRRADFDGMWRFTGASLTPNKLVRQLRDEPSDLYRELWLAAHEQGRLELVPFNGCAVDCGTMADYLAANLTVAGRRDVVAADATVRGEVVDSVVWAGCTVRSGERLVRSIRARDDLTVHVDPG